MNNREFAYSDVEKLVTNFKKMPAAQRRGINENRLYGLTKEEIKIVEGG